jgi:hypothetical protein
MILTSEQVVSNYKDYMTYLVDSVEDGYVLDIKGGLNSLEPLFAVRMLKNNLSFEEKTELCKKAIAKKQVSITLFGESVVEFSLPTPEAEFFAYDAFTRQPTALKFLISAVYSEFLKNSVPQLSASQLAAKEAMLQQKGSKLKGEPSV